MENSPQPYLVIGIDFGMTCTGVAFSQAPRWSEPKTFQQWTAIVSELANKVPSKLSYRPGAPEVQSWGFYCDQDGSSSVVELFKLNLDPEYRDPFEHAPSTNQARAWYCDYLRCIHDHIVHHFMHRVPQWTSVPVEFVFSVPTTWRNPRMIADMETLIRIAGFGADGPLHTSRITLNEAEAAAIAIARHHLSFNDVLMVCDAGGGTSDISILKLCSGHGEPTKLVPMIPIEGGSFGSALIDIEAQQLIISRLTAIAAYLPSDPHDISERMIDGRFERFKCSFGSDSTDIPVLPLLVPGLPPGSNFTQARISDSKMIITREELQHLFERQVGGIIQLIDAQLKSLSQQEPSERVNFLVLSGGLGASPYLRKRIIEHFERGPGNAYGNAQGIKVLLAEQPQLAVAHGLVTERTQMITHGVVAIRDRRSRLSYGVVCDQPYREDKHMGEHIVKDPRDGKRWAKGQIEWVVKKGDKIPVDGIAKEFRAKVQRAAVKHPWKAQIVMSSYSVDQLPRSMAHDGVKILCVVESSLSGVHMKAMNQHWWNRKQKHSVAEFQLKVIPGSADIRFQLWSNQKMISRDHENLAVIWDDAI